MKPLVIPCFEELTEDTDMESLSTFLNTLESEPVKTQLWTKSSSTAQANFTVAHNGRSIFLKFRVLEKVIKAVYRVTNEPVSKDSCVEFFIGLENGNLYYNFEFNCIGTCKAAFGSRDRKERKTLSPAVITRIRRQALIRTGEPLEEGMVSWELTAVIPLEVFCHDAITSLRGLDARGNFYKCGDNLPEPHFMAWNEVKAAKPNFHLPEYFGKMRFL